MKKSGLFLFLLIALSIQGFAQCSITNANGCSCLGGGTNCDLLPDITIASQPLQATGNNGVIENSQDPSIAGADAGRLRISVCTPNIGHGPMETRGDTIWVCGTDTFHGPTAPAICPDGITYPKQLINQRIYHKNGSVMTSYLHPAGTMTYHPTHGHQHIDNWGIYTLRTSTPDPNPLNWPTVGNGAKLAFCLLDYGSCNSYAGYCHDSIGTTLNSSNIPNYGMGGGSYGCSNTVQGISAGFVDIYYQYLDGMWINIPPGVCNGNYYIVVQQDPYNLFIEENENNNVLAIPITLTKQGGTTPTVTAGGPTSFCTGGSVTLTSSFGSNYLWSNGATTKSITVTSPGSYTVTTDVGTNCPATSAPVNITQASVPVTASATSTTLCNGASTQLNATATTSGSTNQQLTFTNNTVFNIPDNNTTGVSSPVTVSGINPTTINANTVVSAKVNITHPYDQDLELRLYAPAGNFQVLSLHRGSSGDNFVNTVFSMSAATAIANGSPPFTGSFKPEGNFASFTGNSNGSWSLKAIDNAGQDVGTINNWTLTLNNVVPAIPTYAWTSSPAGFTSTQQNPTVTPSVTTTYTCVVTDPATGCTGSNSVTITVGNPSVTVSANTSICNGQSATLTASGATTYSWSPSTGLNTTTGSTVIATPGSTTTYTVTGTTNGCSDSKQVTVTVNPSLTVTNSGDVIICSGQSTTLTASGATTYSWSPSTGLSATTGSSVTANPASTQTYTVTGTTNGCSGSSQLTVTVNSTPAVTNSGDVSICAGQSTTLTAGGATTYSWSPSTGLSATTGSSVTANPSSTQTYIVTGTTNGCSSSSQLTVSVTPLPSTSTSGNVSICNGQSTTLTASGATTYSWSPSTGLSATTGSSVTANPSSTQTYTVTGTTNGCSSPASVTVSVNPSPNVVVQGSSVICAGSSTNLTALGATTYSWSPSTGLNTTTGASVTASPTTTTTYTVTGTTNGCSSPYNFTVNVNPIPNVGVSASATTICSGQSSTLTASGATTYSWSPATGLNATTGTSVIASPSSTTTYTVTGTTNGCSNSKTITITIGGANPPNTPGAITGNTKPCPGVNGIPYSIGTVANASSYTWTVPAGASIATGQGTLSLTINYSASFTSGNLCVTANGCGSSAPKCTGIARNIPATPASYSGNINGVCNSSQVYTSAAVAGATSYTWIPPTGATVASGQGNITATVNYSASFTSGNLCVTANNSCMSSLQRCSAIKRAPATPVTITGPALVCAGQTGVNYSTSTYGATTYNWFAPMGSVVASGQGTGSVNINFGSTAGNIGVTAVNSCGSSGTKTQAVTFNCRLAYSSTDEPSLQASPNPVNDLVNVIYTANKQGTAVVRVQDVLGKEMVIKNVTAATGNNVYELDLSKLVGGVYLLSVEQGDGKKVMRIVVN